MLLQVRGYSAGWYNAALVGVDELEVQLPRLVSLSGNMQI